MLCLLMIWRILQLSYLRNYLEHIELRENINSEFLSDFENAPRSREELVANLLKNMILQKAEMMEHKSMEDIWGRVLCNIWRIWGETKIREWMGRNKGDWITKGARGERY